MQGWNRLVWAAAVLAAFAPAATALGAAPCGEVVTVATHGGTTTRYALTSPNNAPPRAALVLMAGGEGDVRLDAGGCAGNLTGNSLVRSIPVFRDLGFASALVDVPSDHTDDDGLAGFRMTAEHAGDIGRIITELRRRTGAGAVWLLGTSRGSISAANAAARLGGAARPDGVVLTSALMAGTARAKKSWMSQTVFDADLAAIRLPLLLIGHGGDKCARSPPDRMARLFDGVTASPRKQMVTVTGGVQWRGGVSLKACAGRVPHGFAGQEAEVARGIARFIEGGRY